ncbi:MAG: hypothetical protein ACRD2Y_14050 [Terriglobales bacterium]
MAALTPIALFLLWFATSAGFRQFALSLDPHTLTIVQAWRMGGYVFLALYAQGILPGLFALPAGLGDMAIAATAPLVAIKLANPGHRQGFVLWQVLGILDLVVAVSLGTLAGLISPHPIGSSPMTLLPLSLIPAFAVPLFVILHVICIARAKQWTERQYSRVGGQLPSAAA